LPTNVLKKRMQTSLDGVQKNLELSQFVCKFFV